MAAQPPYFWLNEVSQPQGPLPLAALDAKHSAGELSGAVLVWHEGSTAGWTPLEQVLAAAAGRARPVAQQAQAAVRSNGPVLSAAPAPVDALAAWQAEVAQLESAAAERPESPEERSFVDDDGTAYTWDSVRRAFVPQPTAASAALPTYAAEDMTFPDDEPPPPPPPPRPAPALADEDDPEDPAAVRAGAVAREQARQAEKAAAAAARKEAAPKVSTSVYVTGLPDDATVEEVAAVFSRCGLIKEDDAGAPRVKLYADKATGMLKGDGLVVFLKEPSVALACTILDGASLRPGQGPVMSVTPAKFEPKQPGAAGAAAAGAKTAAPKPAGQAINRKRKAGATAEKALGWDGFDDVVDPKQVVVVLSGMFEPAELDSPSAVAELKADVAAEASKFGAVAACRVFERHPQGIITVKYKDPESARACLIKMHGRFFGGRRVSAAMYDGRTDFGLAGAAPKGETEEEQAARLERYAAELEASFE